MDVVHESITPADCRRWYREGEIVALTVLVAACYLPWLGNFTVRGEEPRWATIAREMQASGDWIVPRQQGEPFLSRPPLGNWLIAVSAYIRGGFDTLAIRLPTVLAVLLTTLLIYGFCRTFLSRLGALTAAAAYPTMGQVLQLGRLGETEGVFTLLLSASLLVWYWGFTQRWRAIVLWICSYTLAAFAALAKGPQAPLYFVSATYGFLILTGNWRWLCSRAHLFGVAAFLVVVAAWQVPFLLQTDWPSVRAIWGGDTAARLTDWRPTTVITHLAAYPVELLVCIAPWSLLLCGFASRTVRAAAWEARQPILFLSLCLSLAFLTCWLMPGGRGRYMMPLFPCLAPIFGLIVQSWADGFDRRKAAWSVFAFAGVVGVAVSVLQVQIMIRKTEDTAGAIAALKRQIPPGTKLVSFECVRQLFTYYYETPIPMQHWPERPDEVADDAYFCFSWPGHQVLPMFPFPWEPIAIIPCDRYHKPKPEDIVVAGRRLPANVATASAR